MMLRILTGAFLVFGFMQFALAAVPPGLDMYRTARSDFERIVKETEEKGDMPGRHGPRAVAVLSILSDAASVLGSKEYVKEDLGYLKEICGD